jgi:hypothetical protein
VDVVVVAACGHVAYYMSTAKNGTLKNGGAVVVALEKHNDIQ